MQKPIDLYGIKNCDTVKKALKWLNENEINCVFHDFKKESPEPSLVAIWFEQIGADKVINRRGTTWRGLSEQQQALSAEQDLIQLVIENPSLIKRPVVCHQSVWSVGFDPVDWDLRFR